MERRKRYANLVWLRALPTDDEPGRAHVAEVPKPTVQTSISILGERFGLLVEIEQRHGLYAVRTIPMQRDQTGAPVGTAASYVGANLASILGTAVRDYMHIEEYPNDAKLGPREFTRKVG